MMTMTMITMILMKILKIISAGQVHDPFQVPSGLSKVLIEYLEEIQP